MGEDIEDKLFEVGSQLGRRFNELAALRELGQHSRLCEASPRKETRLLRFNMYITAAGKSSLDVKQIR